MYSYKEWRRRIQENKNPMLILSFPAVQLLNMTVKDIVSNADAQAETILKIKEECPKQAAYIGLMDLSLEAQAFGSKVEFSDNEVPNVKDVLIHSYDEAKTLKLPDSTASRCKIYLDAMAKVAEQAKDAPVFAGVIGPFSLAGRLMGVSEIMMEGIMNPDYAKEVIKKASSFILSYIEELKKRSVDGVIMAEPLAGLLSSQMLEEFSSVYIKEIVDKVQEDSFSVFYHNCGPSTNKSLKEIYETGCAGYHFGNAVNIEEILKETPSDILVMGNLDPVQCFCSDDFDELKRKVMDIKNITKQYDNFIISSGCDIPPQAKWASIRKFFELI